MEAPGQSNGEKTTSSRPVAQRLPVDEKDDDPEKLSEILENILTTLLRIPEAWRKQHLKVEGHENLRGTRPSPAYPGLPTTYFSHVVKMRVADVSHPNCRGILGLPHGAPFMTTDAKRVKRSFVWDDEDTINGVIDSGRHH